MNTAHKKFILLTLILFSIMIFANNAQAISDCIIRNRDSNPSDMYLLGYVSTMGHFADNLSVRVDYPKALFCNHALTGDRTDGGETIYFSDPNQEVMPGVWGSGHVSITNNTVSFHGTSSLGFEAGQCEIKPASDSCNSGDLCVFKISNPEQGHIGDCNDNTEPNTHNYQHKLCCTPTEYCRDGIDNTGDGLIDCASPECHPSPINLEPEQCNPTSQDVDIGLGNWQNTTGCVINYDLVNDVTIYNSSCIGTSSDVDDETGWISAPPWPQGFPGSYEYPVVNASYYCSYGINDDGSQTGGEGFCCPTGTRALYDEDLDMWECRDFEECGMGINDDCKDADYRLGVGFADWLNSSYDDDENDWCVSMLPSFYNPITQPTSFNSSMGCCFVPHYGEYGFYHKAGNIKTFGTK